MEKHIWTQIVSVVMSFAVVVTMLPAVAFGATIVASGYCGGEGNGENLKWELDSEGTLTIRGEGEMKEWGYYNEVPWNKQRSDITKVIIGDGATSLGAWAFYRCTNLSAVALPDGLTSIGIQAFCYCQNLRFLYKGIIIKHNKTEPTYTKTSLFLCEKRRFFMARTEKGVVATI